MKKEIITLFISLVTLVIGAQNDKAGSEDYYLLDRLPDYYIKDYSDIEFGSHEFYIEGENISKEGRKYVIKYRHKEENTKDFKFPSRLQILRNYSNAIVSAGGRILFERYNHEHGYYSFSVNGKTLWVQIKTANRGHYYSLHIIEEELMKQTIIIDEELIKSSLEIEGKIAVYGIYFDTGKSIVKEESKPALEQIAAFLKNNPNVNCWVVGHTDSDGSFEVNSKLSLDRATAIKMVIENMYGVGKERLFAEGVGPLAPVASNITEEGKQLNRRVELVKK